MRTLDKIITKVNLKFGAPLGRPNVGSQPVTITSGPNNRIVKRNQVKVFDSAVRLDNGGYDKHGVYWGISSQLRVRYTKDLTYIEFYRVE